MKNWYVFLFDGDGGNFCSSFIRCEMLGFHVVEGLDSNNLSSRVSRKQSTNSYVMHKAGFQVDAVLWIQLSQAIASWVFHSAFSVHASFVTFSIFAAREEKLPVLMLKSI